MSENKVIIGLDLSYSVNKKSYNIIDASSFNDFCKSKLNIEGGVNSVNNLISFGSDRYGIIYNNNDDNDNDNEQEEVEIESEEKSDKITGFILNKNEYNILNESVSKSLNNISNLDEIIFSNTASGSEIVIFDNKNSQMKTIDLFDKKEKEQIKKENNYLVKKDEHDGDGDDEEEEEEEIKEDNKEKDEKEEEEEEENDDDSKDGIDKNKNQNQNQKQKKKNKKNKIKTTPKFKVKSSIKKIFKHLLLTVNGSLYGLQKSFHKKYVNNQKVIEVKSDGNRCTLCLDENGVLWSFGINLFGKLGLKRNDKKQEYTNPREISIFKAYKVSDFGITNRCCIAVCANGSIYGWGSYSKLSLSNNGDYKGDIWYTPNLISANDDTLFTSNDNYQRKKQQYKVYAGYRFIMLLNITTNKLYLINTEFGYKLIDKPKNGLIIQTQQIKLSKDLLIKHVIPSNETAIVIADKIN